MRSPSGACGRRRVAGWEIGGELPDRLPVVLECVALARPRPGRCPLGQHRRGLDAWPFARLVHVWSAPVGHLVRPYLVYRGHATAFSRSASTSGRSRAMKWPASGTSVKSAPGSSRRSASRSEGRDQSFSP